MTATPATPQLPVPDTEIQDTAAILHIPGGVFLEIRNGASAEFLKKLIGVTSHAQ